MLLVLPDFRLELLEFGDGGVLGGWGEVVFDLNFSKDGGILWRLNFLDEKILWGISRTIWCGIFVLPAHGPRPTFPFPDRSYLHRLEHRFQLPPFLGQRGGFILEMPLLRVAPPFF